MHITVTAFCFLYLQWHGTQLRDHQQKTFVTLSRYWPFSEWGVWVNRLKRENLSWKSFFQIMLNEALKSCKKWYISADVKADVNQQVIKELVASCIFNFYKRYVPSKLEMQCKTGIYFSFIFAWYFIQFDIVHY